MAPFGLGDRVAAGSAGVPGDSVGPQARAISQLDLDGARHPATDSRVEQDVNRIERAVRRAINPLSTRVTMLVQSPTGLVRTSLARVWRPGELVTYPDDEGGFTGHLEGESGMVSVVARLPVVYRLARRARQRAAVQALSSGHGSQPRPGRRAARGVDASEREAGVGNALVPNVIGVSYDDACVMLARLGLGAREPEGTATSLSGVVVNQYPDSGAVVPEGTVVTLWVHRGPGSAGVREPRRPRPDPSQQRGLLDERTGRAIG